MSKKFDHFKFKTHSYCCGPTIYKFNKIHFFHFLFCVRGLQLVHALILFYKWTLTCMDVFRLLLRQSILFVCFGWVGCGAIDKLLYVVMFSRNARQWVGTRGSACEAGLVSWKSAQHELSFHPLLSLSLFAKIWFQHTQSLCWLSGLHQRRQGVVLLTAKK